MEKWGPMKLRHFLFRHRSPVGWREGMYRLPNYDVGSIPTGVSFQNLVMHATALQGQFFLVAVNGVVAMLKLDVFAYEVALSSAVSVFDGHQIVIIELRDKSLAIRGVGQMLPDGSVFLAAAEVRPEEELIVFHHETDVVWWEAAQYRDWEVGDLFMEDEKVRFVKN